MLLAVALVLVLLAVVLVLVVVFTPEPIHAPTPERLIAFHTRPRAEAVHTDPRDRLVASYAALQKRR